MGRDCGSDLPTFQILKPEYFSKKKILCTKLRIELNIYELRHFAQKKPKTNSFMQKSWKSIWISICFEDIFHIVRL